MKKFLLLSAAALCAMTVSAQAQTDVIRLCTGSTTGVYYGVGELIAGFSVAPIEVIETTGTFENMERTLNGDCDAMIGQPDGPVYLKRTKPADAAKLGRVMKLHREYLHVLCSKESGIDDLDEIGSSHTVAIGAQGSGSWLMWENFGEQDADFADVKTTTDSGLTALTAVAANEVQCMLVPSGVPNGTISDADATFGDAVVLSGATDKDFNDAVDVDGKGLYEFVDMPTDRYPVTFDKYWGDVKTLTWSAGLYVNKQKMTGKKLEGFLKAATRARTTILSNYGK